MNYWIKFNGFLILLYLYVYTNKYKMNTKYKKSKLINIRIDEELLSNYKEYCAKHGYDVSKRIRMYISADMNHKLEGLFNEKTT